MPILESATVEQLRRLLELFPSSHLRNEWPGTKGMKKIDACATIAGTMDYARVRSFLINNFGHCRQHALLLQRPATLADLTTAFPLSESIGTFPGNIEFRLTSVPYTVYLLNPLEPVQIDVLWPFRIEYRDEVVILRFVVLERDPPN
jgi:hypothetical protein